MKNKVAITILELLLFTIALFLLNGDNIFAQDDANIDRLLPKPVENIKDGTTLNINRCVELAVKNQPAIISALNSIEASRSRVGQAQANYYPQAELSSGYSKTYTSSEGSSLVSSSTRDQYSFGASIQQNIYDFGKTSSSVDAQRYLLDSSQSDYIKVTLQVIFNVKQAYYSLLQAKRNQDVLAQSVKQYEQHLEQAKEFYKVGLKPKIEVTKAEVDLSNAKIALIKARNALKLAVVTLNNAMGIPSNKEFPVEDNLYFEKYDISPKQAIETAYNERPDMKSAALKTKAAQETVKLKQADYYPKITGNFAYNKTGENHPQYDNWSISAQIALPVFNGFITKEQVEEARANLNIAKADENILKESVFLEVQQAYLSLNEAKETIPSTEIALRQAKENLDIANGRYKAGVGNTIEVTDAEVLYSNANKNYIAALAEYKIAQARLEQAMGISTTTYLQNDFPKKQ
ncbi:outer membrane efflux protein [Candidatus Magnetoovum chiemensis]|nr:outer membrane efflux protein [Candidatus Magnetoovum chiemensis]